MIQKDRLENLDTKNTIVVREGNLFRFCERWGPPSIKEDRFFNFSFPSSTLEIRIDKTFYSTLFKLIRTQTQPPSTPNGEICQSFVLFLASESFFFPFFLIKTIENRVSLPLEEVFISKPCKSILCGCLVFVFVVLVFPLYFSKSILATNTQGSSLKLQQTLWKPKQNAIGVVSFTFPQPPNTTFMVILFCFWTLSIIQPVSMLTIRACCYVSSENQLDLQVGLSLASLCFISRWVQLLPKQSNRWHC